MKKIAFWAFAALLFVSPSIFASDTQSESQSAATYSPEVCQFSLSRYSGTIGYSGDTDKFTVGLSCPQEKAVHATVAVFIDGEIVASKVVEVQANKTTSGSVYINVGSGYNGKKYQLVVQ